MATKYRGRTERGRETVQDSLAAAVEDVAFLARKDPAECVTYQRTPDIWYVYEDQVALDVDMSRGTTSAESSDGWFAIVTAEEQSAAPERK